MFYARVAQGWSTTLPRWGPRVRIPSRALFNSWEALKNKAFQFFCAPHFYYNILQLQFTETKNRCTLQRLPLKCPKPESNQRHEDFQSSALPTELSGLIDLIVVSLTTWTILHNKAKVVKNFIHDTPIIVTISAVRQDI